VKQILCVADNYNIVQLLIDNGANIEGSDLHFGRPLHLAALKGHVCSAKVLLLAGKEFEITIFLDSVSVNTKLLCLCVLNNLCCLWFILGTTWKV